MTDMITNPHFQRWAAVLRFPFRYLLTGGSTRRTNRQPWATWAEELTTAVKLGNSQDVIRMIATINPELAMISPRLQVTTDDVTWLVEQIDLGPGHWQPMMYTMLAYASAPDTQYTPEELARVTDTAKSTWRHYASSGQVPGSLKKGNTWLLPRGVVLAMGLATLNQLQGETEDE